MDNSSPQPEKQFRIPDIFIARDGTWYSDGAQVIHHKIFQLFNENLHRDADGSYFIRVWGQQCPVRVENTPFVVRSLFWENDAQGRDVLWLTLNSGVREALDPATLVQADDGELHCRLQNGLTAALNRHAATQLGQFLEQDDAGAYYVMLNGERYFL